MVLFLILLSDSILLLPIFADKNIILTLLVGTIYLIYILRIMEILKKFKIGKRRLNIQLIKYKYL